MIPMHAVAYPAWGCSMVEDENTTSFCHYTRFSPPNYSEKFQNRFAITMVQAKKPANNSSFYCGGRIVVMRNRHWTPI
jgi:hypothetical protein